MRLGGVVLDRMLRQGLEENTAGQHGLRRPTSFANSDSPRDPHAWALGLDVGADPIGWMLVREIAISGVGSFLKTTR